jgi:hypothetical protein
MPMRYGEEVQAGRGGMARAAKAQGRGKNNDINQVDSLL